MERDPGGQEGARCRRRCPGHEVGFLLSEVRDLAQEGAAIKKAIESFAQGTA
jgi:hypothetical protein